MGTPGSVAYLNAIGGLPTRNFQDPTFPDADRISGKTMQQTILRERDTCQACPIRCKQVVEYTRGEAEEKLSRAGRTPGWSSPRPRWSASSRLRRAGV